MRARRQFLGRAAHVAVALVATLGLGLVAAPGTASADPGDTWEFPNRLADGKAETRLDRCMLGFVVQAGGPEMRKVAQPALVGTDAQMHAAAQSWDRADTPLGVAYAKDDAARDAKWQTLGDRHYTWDDSIPSTFSVVEETVTDFRWSPNFYADLGIVGFYTRQYLKLGDAYSLVDLNPVASAGSVASATAIAKQQRLYYGNDGPRSTQEYISWGDVGDTEPFNNGSITRGDHYADDVRAFLQYAGFPKTAPDPASPEFRLEVEALKQRFSSCETKNPLDPNHVLAPVVRKAEAEWRAELDGQSAQRDAIVNAQIKAYNDLEAAAIAMGEAVGQSWIAQKLSKWQACHSAGGLCTAGVGPMTIRFKANTTLCLDNTGNSSANGNKIELWTCTGGTPQQWRPAHDSIRYLDGQLINPNGKCLDLSGTSVVLNACVAGKIYQRWQYATTGGQTTLYNAGGRLCLDFAQAAAGQFATVKTCTNGTTQQFVTSQNNQGTGTGNDSLTWPKAADFSYAATEIKNAQNRAAAQLTIANNAAADAQVQATAVTNAQNAATAVANTNGYPVGRGLAYAQQSAQVTKASAAGAQAAAKATATAVQATKAAVADSATLVSLAQTQATAMRAEYAKTAAQEAARQAKAAAQAAAAQATAAAADAATAKAKRVVAEQARATAQTAADKAAQQRQIAERERRTAADQRAIAEEKRAVAASASASAQNQQQIATAARAQAEADARTAADRDFDAQTAADGAHIARSNAENAARQRDALTARAAAVEARADSDEGSDAAVASRAAANDAQSAADRAATAATRAEHDAAVATEAAEDARAAATAARAAAARSKAAADKADHQVAITRSAVATAHAAAAEALAAARDAKQHANNADAEAARAAAEMREAARQAAEAKSAATLAQAQAVATAGKAYATAQAAIAARDSAVAVAAPANEAVGLGAPFAERDTSAALATLVGQGALTVSQQQAAAAQARADEAQAASANAAALAAAAVGDAKFAAQAAADAAKDAGAAAKSARDARASAAAAAADAAAAAQAEAATVQLNAQAERDAAAAHAAATAASGDADAADAAADSAERDAAAARAAATQARAEANAAQEAADRADQYADQAEAAAARAREDAEAAERAAAEAEMAAREQDRTGQIVSTSDDGYIFVNVVSSDVTVDPGEGSCEARPTCDVQIPVRMTGTLYYEAVICLYTGPGTVSCDHVQLASRPFDFTQTRTLHLDVRVVLKASLANLANVLFGDFIGCGKAIAKGSVNGDCAWAAASVIPYERLLPMLRAVIGFNAAAKYGDDLTQAFNDLRASDIDVSTVVRLEKDISDQITAACLVGGRSAKSAKALAPAVPCKRVQIGPDLYQYPDGSIRNGLGHFAGTNGTRVGAVAERAVMDNLARQGYKVIRSQVAVRDATGQLRLYDCAIDLGNNKLIGVEVKSGTATLTPEQRAFDARIRAGMPAPTVGSFGNTYTVVDVRLEVV